MDIPLGFTIEHSTFFQEGDPVIVFDLPATFNGYVGDTHANITCHYPGATGKTVDLDQTVSIGSVRRAY